MIVERVIKRRKSTIRKRTHIFDEKQKIGNLVFLREGDWIISKSRKTRSGVFLCNCGKEFKTSIYGVKRGETVSCGCKKKNQFKKKNPFSNDFLYRRWTCIKSRCYNKNCPDYVRYGGRGIIMADLFLKDFLFFKKYIESLPFFELAKTNDLQIDRMDNDGNYEIGNLRWATRTEQANNRRIRKDARIKKYVL